MPFTLILKNKDLLQPLFGRTQPIIEALYNIKKDGIILTLVNNDGITKCPSEPAEIDNSKTKQITIRFNDYFFKNAAIFTGKHPILIRDLISGEVLWKNTGDSAKLSEIRPEVTIPPGDLKIIEFKFI